MYKTCQKCLASKALDQFHKCARAKDGRQGRCKPCAIAAAREHYETHREQATITRRAWQAKNAKKHGEATKKWRAAHPDKWRLMQVKRVYGLSESEYRELEARANGVCGICKKPPEGDGRGMRQLHVDHNHTTGKVRALLCKKCNLAVGYLEENAGRARDLAIYLDTHNPERM